MPKPNLPTRVDAFLVMAVTTDDLVLEIGAYTGHNASVVAWSKAHDVDPQVYRATFVVKGILHFPESVST